MNIALLLLVVVLLAAWMSVAYYRDKLKANGVDLFLLNVAMIGLPVIAALVGICVLNNSIR